MMQSDGSEFGVWEGYEHTSMSSPPVPTSAAVRQQSIEVSLVVQLPPLHFVLV